MTQTIAARVTAIVIDHLAVPADDVTPAATFEDLGADSLDLIEMVLACEEAFGIPIPDDDIAALRTVADVITYLTVHSSPATT